MTLEQFARKALEIGKGRKYINVKAELSTGSENDGLDIPIYTIWDEVSRSFFHGSNPEIALAAYREMVNLGTSVPADIEIQEATS